GSVKCRRTKAHKSPDASSDFADREMTYLFDLTAAAGIAPCQPVTARHHRASRVVHDGLPVAGWRQHAPPDDMVFRPNHHTNTARLTGGGDTASSGVSAHQAKRSQNGPAKYGASSATFVSMVTIPAASHAICIG